MTYDTYPSQVGEQGRDRCLLYGHLIAFQVPSIASVLGASSSNMPSLPVAWLLTGGVPHLRQLSPFAHRCAATHSRGAAGYRHRGGPAAGEREGWGEYNCVKLRMSIEPASSTKFLGHLDMRD